LTNASTASICATRLQLAPRFLAEPTDVTAKPVLRAMEKRVPQSELVVSDRNDIALTCDLMFQNFIKDIFINIF